MWRGARGCRGCGRAGVRRHCGKMTSVGSHETFATRNDPLLVKTADGCPLPLRRFGPPEDGAPAVLLIAGGDGAMRWWRALVPALCFDEAERRLFAPLAPPRPFEAGLQVVAWDARGGGWAGRGHGTAAAHPVAADILRIAGGLFDHPVHLVGHGLGGLAAALAAVEQPERVASLTLVAAPLESEGVAVGDLALGTPVAVLRALSPAWAAAHEEVAAALVREATVAAAWGARLSVPDRRARSAATEAKSAGLTVAASGMVVGAAVAALDAPLLLVHGRHDAIVPAEQSRALACRARPGARVVELDAGHLVPVERAPELAAAIIAHLAAAERA